MIFAIACVTRTPVSCPGQVKSRPLAHPETGVLGLHRSHRSDRNLYQRYHPRSARWTRETLITLSYKNDKRGMENTPKVLKTYTTDDGKTPFKTWLASFKDKRIRARILQRLDRLQLGNFGDCKSVGLAFMS